MSLLILIMGLVDIVAAVALWNMGIFGPGAVSAIGWLIALKGAYSIVMSVLGNFYYDVLGWIDVLAGVMLLLGFAFPFFWVLVAGKGLYSFVVFMATWK